MSDNTPRLGLPDLPDTPELYADTVADAFARIDAFTDLYLKGQFVNTPPPSPADGDAYLVGGGPTGAWSGYPYKIAACRDGAWTLLTPFNGLRAYVASTGAFIVYADGVWTDWTSLISTAEASIASAATCDVGAAGSLCLLITGTTAITSLGAGVCKLRFLRFAGALTLAHDATNLVLPGGTNIVTAAGDTAIFTSDGGGRWRCRCYQRASGLPVSLLNPAITGTLAAAAASFSGPVTFANAPQAWAGTGQTTGAQYGLFSNASATGLFGIENSAGNSTISGSLPYSTFVGSYASTPFHLVVGAGVAATIGTDKSFLLGTTANGGWSGSAKQAIYSTGNGLSIESNGSGVPLSLRVNYNSANHINFYGGATMYGSVSNPTGTAMVYATTSDARLKTVLAEQGNYRDAIKALWVGDFEWKANGTKAFGVLAQQAYGVMPHGLGVTRPADDAGQWQASAEPFAHLALWGVKDLYAMIEALAARLAVLEAAHAAG